MCVSNTPWLWIEIVELLEPKAPIAQTYIQFTLIELSSLSLRVTFIGAKKIMYIVYYLIERMPTTRKIGVRRTNELNWFVVYWCLSKRKRSPFRRVVVVAHQTDIYEIPYDSAAAATPFAAFIPITTATAMTTTTATSTKNGKNWLNKTVIDL